MADGRPAYSNGERVWLARHSGAEGRTLAVVLTVGPSRVRVRYHHPATPSRPAHPAERWAGAAELAPRSTGHPIDTGYAEPAATAATSLLDVLSDEPPHPDDGPAWPLRIVHVDGSAHEDAVRGRTEARAMESAWWNWPSALRIESGEPAGGAS